MKLVEDLKSCKNDRKKYRIKPTIKFYVDKQHYYFAFFPTVLWMPWVYRYPNINGVIDIWWLHFHILIGKWEHLSCHSCVHEYECIDNKKRDSYFDDIMTNDKKCSDFKTR